LDKSEEETGGAPFRHQHQPGNGTSWEHRKPPMELEALTALEDIEGLLRLHTTVGKKKQRQYKPSKVQGWLEHILWEIKAFLNLYMGTKSLVKGQWITASKLAVQSLCKSTDWAARKLHKMQKTLFLLENYRNRHMGVGIPQDLMKTRNLSPFTYSQRASTSRRQILWNI